MSRRGMLGSAMAAAAAMLVACGGGQDVQRAVNAAAEEVDGVQSSDLELASGATFQPLMRGTITTTAGTRSEGLEIFGRAMGAVARTAVEQGDPEAERSRVVGAVIAVTESGEELGIWDLRPDLESSKGRLDAVIVEDFLGS